MERRRRYHLQKQPSTGNLQNKNSEKTGKIHGKTPVLEFPFFLF